ncbi:hypothetical protein V8F33_001544 [Rhypophila sp. PSN 637]
MAKKSNHGAEAKVLRKLGINEAYQLGMYLIDQYRGTCLSCRYAIPARLASAESQGQLEEAVKMAVVDVITRHPMLQVGVKDAKSKTPSWIQLPSLDLTNHIQWRHLEEHADDDDFEQVVQNAFCAQLDEHFPDASLLREQPGWKITIFRRGNTMEVLLCWNHHHFDAVGAKVIHQDFLSMLNAAGGNEALSSDFSFLNGDDILTLPESPPPLLPTPIETLRQLPVDFRFLAKAVWEEYGPRFLTRDITWAAWCPIVSSPYKTQYRAFYVDKASLSAILALCRQHTTTITGLMNALALVSFSSRLDSKAAPAFQSSTMIDHRRNLPPADVPWGKNERAVGNYVTQLMHRYEPGLVAGIRSKLLLGTTEGGGDLSADLVDELWAESARNRTQIVDKLQNCQHNDLIGLFKWVNVSDWRSTMRDMAKKTRQFSWIVTNIGVMMSGGGSGSGDEDDQKCWSMTRAQFGLSAEIPAAAIEFSPVSVAGQGMSVGASWPDCALDSAFGEGVMADMERWLGQLVKGG